MAFLWETEEDESDSKEAFHPEPDAFDHKPNNQSAEYYCSPFSLPLMADGALRCLQRSLQVVS